MRADKNLPRPKRPTEEFPVGWDFVNDVKAGDSYSAHTITAFDVATSADVSATFLQGATRVGTSGAILAVQIQGGTDGHDYDVLFALFTTQGDRFDRVIRVAVRA